LETRYTKCAKRVWPNLTLTSGLPFPPFDATILCTRRQQNNDRSGTAYFPRANLVIVPFRRLQRSSRAAVRHSSSNISRPVWLSIRACAHFPVKAEFIFNTRVPTIFTPNRSAFSPDRLKCLEVTAQMYIVFEKCGSRARAN
jgi:hypothetical protein